MSGKGLWGKKTFCIITGASQGIGRTLSVEFSKLLSAGSTVVLTARSQPGLESTKSLIESSAKDISVKVECQDLSKPDISYYEELIKKYSKDKFESFMLVHNAGSEGSGKLAVDMSSLDEWQLYMNLNLFHVTLLTSAFLSALPSDGVDKVIINITSLAALQPFPGLGYYCIGKASREMYFKVLAAENPSLRVVSYSPGPVATSMIGRVIDKLQVNETKKAFTTMRDESTLLSPEITIAKLVGILEKNKFPTGERFDYFDEPH